MKVQCCVSGGARPFLADGGAARDAEFLFADLADSGAVRGQGLGKFVEQRNEFAKDRFLGVAALV